MPTSDDSTPPLVTPRSPSYERARQEHEHPSPPGDAQVIAVLSRLIEAQVGVAQALRAADAEDEATQHEGRARALGQMIEALGGSPPRPGELRSILRHDAGEVERASPEQRHEILRELRDELAAEVGQALADEALSDAQRDLLRKIT